MALYYKNLVLGDLRTFCGPSGGFFTGRALREEKRGDKGIVLKFLVTTQERTRLELKKKIHYQMDCCLNNCNLPRGTAT